MAVTESGPMLISPPPEWRGSLGVRVTLDDIRSWVRRRGFHQSTLRLSLECGQKVSARACVVKLR